MQSAKMGLHPGRPQERVVGLGGIFFKARDPAALVAWYREHLGIIPSFEHGAVFPSDEPPSEREGYVVWSAFAEDTSYFDPSPAAFMINFRVADLDAMLQQLRVAGARVDDRVEESEFGRFGWVTDPEDNRIELWEPPLRSRS